MLLYKFEKRAHSNKIPYYSDLETGTVAGFSDADSIVSLYPEIRVGDLQYIEDLATGAYFKYTEASYKKYQAPSAVLVPQCKRGISIFNNMSSSRRELYHVERGGVVYLTLEFNTDNDGNIWSRVFTLDDDGKIVVDSGYMIYKNARNNFANVALSETKYSTVLTNGNIDKEKVDLIKGISTDTQSKTSYANKGKIKLDTTTGGTTSVYRSQIPSSNSGSITTAYKKAIATRAQGLIQNDYGYPKYLGTSNGIAKYDYSMQYSELLCDMSKIYKNTNSEIRSVESNISANMSRYNRFKIANPDDILSRGFMHIFFTRPDCNFYSDATGNLNTFTKADPFVKFIKLKNSGLIDQLVLENGSKHQFMMLLSNKIKGFSLTDDGMNSDNYGKSRSGFSIAYGRRRDMEVGQTLDITFRDTRDFDIINLHKLWMDYIINVFKGKWTPKDKYIRDKVLDYAVSLYVVVTAEDFETVLFWSKYYGIFPVSIPYSSIAWTGDGSPVTPQDLTITYRYSWKEDLNPVTWAELNSNAFKGNVPKTASYVPTYRSTRATVNDTWVGAPFIETVKYSSGDADLTNGAKITPKLRFRK